MKKVTIMIAALMLSAVTYAQTWTMDKAHARLGFTITHLMVNDVDGMFKTFDASIVSSKPDFSDANFSLNANTSSVFTDNEKRDAHLRSADFFDVEKYPAMTFQSTSVTSAGPNKLKIKGNLSMHGITKVVVLDVSFKGPATHPMTKKPVAGFKVTGVIRRSDFKIGDSMPAAILGDDVVITANGEFQQ
jgi:polyisoprenoid-binding protein YceI